MKSYTHQIENPTYHSEGLSAEVELEHDTAEVEDVGATWCVGRQGTLRQAGFAASSNYICDA